MEFKRKDLDSQLTIWIIVTTLLHILVVVVMFFLYVNEILKNHFHKQNKVDPIDLQSQAKQNMMRAHEPDVTYTLMPGSKATKDQSEPEPVKQQETVQDEKIKISEQPTKQTEITAELSNNNHHKSFQQATQMKADITKQLNELEKLKQSLTKPTPSTEEKPKPKDQPKSPVVKKSKITLQDLNLSFSKFLHEGNSEAILQQGNSNQPPDAQTLKALTYKDQVGKTILAAVRSHELFQKVIPPRNSSTKFSITIDRTGRLLQSEFKESCGNQMVDKMIMDSISSVKLYPEVPKHLPDTLLHQNWNYIHQY